MVKAHSISKLHCIWKGEKKCFFSSIMPGKKYIMDFCYCCYSMDNIHVVVLAVVVVVVVFDAVVAVCFVVVVVVVILSWMIKLLLKVSVIPLLPCDFFPRHFSNVNERTEKTKQERDGSNGRLLSMVDGYTCKTAFENAASRHYAVTVGV